METRTREIPCPCCGATLTVDLDTGALLSHEAPKKSLLSFEDAAQQVKAVRQRAETAFDRAMEERQHRNEILEKKFRKALEKASEDPAPPEKPFDLD